MKKKILLLCISSVVAVICVCYFYHADIHADISADIPNVVIVSLSGISNEHSIDDPVLRFMPKMWGVLAQEGTVYSRLKNRNVKFHMPVTQAINSGIHYPAYVSMKGPTLFQYVGRKYDLKRTQVWSIGHWYDMNIYYGKEYKYPLLLSASIYKISPELEPLLNVQEKKFFHEICKMQKQSDAWPNWDSGGEVIFGVAKKIFKTFKPKLVHYVMNDSETAHYGSFSRYMFSVNAIDDKIYDLWTYLRNEPFYKDNTYFIVNIDHERDPYYMEHDKAIDPVWMYIYGPTIKKGIVIDRVIEHVDIFATVAQLMKVKTHPTPGTFLKDCFEVKKRKSD